MKMGGFQLAKRLGVQVRWQLRRLQRLLTRSVSAMALVCLLAAAIAIGGASRDNALFWWGLEFLSLLAVGLSLLLQTPERFPRRALVPAVLMSAFVMIGLLQLIPLPWSLWSALPGHDLAAEGLRLLGLNETFHPLSLAPDSTITALVRFLPAIGIFWLALQIERRTLFAIVTWVLPALGLAAMAMGLAQMMLGSRLNLHLYPWTIATLPSGTFANVNHQATFLLMCTPFAAIHAAPSRWSRSASVLENLFVRLLPVALLVVGAVMTLSGAGILMAPMVLIGSLLLARRRQSRNGDMIIGGAFLATLVAMGAALFGTTLLEDPGEEFGPSERSRAAIYSHTLDAATDFLPLGSGLGSFVYVYPAYENPTAIEQTYVNHAHNEYLELFLELGIPGLCVLVAVLVWWIRSVRRIWLNRDEGSGFGRAAMAGSVALAVVVVHSLVDYPVRTPAIACVAALCLAVMIRAETRRISKSEAI